MQQHKKKNKTKAAFQLARIQTVGTTDLGSGNTQTWA